MCPSLCCVYVCLPCFHGYIVSVVTVVMQGFREKNRDLMRQDIVDVLKTSRMDLVRALIGQPSYAVQCWHMAHLKLMAAFAFR